MFQLPDWPLYGYADDVRPFLAESVSQGSRAVVATLVDIRGGGPRPVGTQMAFAGEAAAGFLSGGCVEGDVAQHAAGVMETGIPTRLVYGEGSPFFDIRLLCGARIDLALERLDPDDPALLRLLELREQRIAALWLSDGKQRMCVTDSEQVPAGFTDIARLALGSGACAGFNEAGQFWRRFDAPLRIFVVGRDPTSLAMATLAMQAGYETILVRNKGPEMPPPLPGLIYRRGSLAAAFAEFPVDSRTAVAVASHDMEEDHDSLIAALGSPAGYVGVLGGRRQLPLRLARLEAAGMTPEQIARLKAPIGLDLGGKAPWEIAVAVIAQIIADRIGAR